MKILHWLRQANSGLNRTTLEIAKAEEDLGHTVTIKQPADGVLLYGEDMDPDVHCVHSQLPAMHLYDNKPKFLWAHAEPGHAIANGVTFQAMLELAPKADAIICMRRDEQEYWSHLARTYVVTKGIDLDVFKPQEVPEEKKLAGRPAVLYYENWRGERNPLPWIVAMARVFRRLPEAKLHLYNCPDKDMGGLFLTAVNQCKWAPFVASLCGPEEDVSALINSADIVVSSIPFLYARSIEAFGCGKPLICPGYRLPSYPYQCEFDPVSMAQALADAWERRELWGARRWAEEHHDVCETARQAVAVYERYL